MSRYLPKSIVCFHEGYTKRLFLQDLIAGITVGVIALPLAMAFGIASIPEHVAREAGISPPAAGLYTAVIAGSGETPPLSPPCKGEGQALRFALAEW